MPSRWPLVGPSTARERSVAGGVAVLVAVASFTALAGVPGTFAGAVLLASWVLAPPVVAVALGQVAVASVVTPGAGLREVALAEGPLLAVLAVDASGTGASVREWTLAAVVTAAFAGLAVLTVRSVGSLWRATTVCLVGGSVAVYGLHRYAIVRQEGARAG